MKPPKTADALGSNIRAMRLLSRLSQQQLAVAAKTDTNYLRGIELGQRNPTVRVLERIASALGVEVIDLFDAP